MTAALLRLVRVRVALGLVPKAMDVVSGAASQATMLDYTVGPVVLAGVTLP